ncbi:MAG: ABC transporter ATP-binding protein [Thermodesulfobacteriota bacterium]
MIEMIEVKDLKKSFNGQEVLRGVNLTIHKGETTTIIGRSGGGKSVLLKHLIGVIRPDSGSIVVDGEDITKMNNRELKQVKRKFGMVFQFAALFDSMTVFDNIAFQMRELSALKEDDIIAQTIEMLKRIGMEGMGDKYPDEISGGMAKRVGLARALVMRPEYMFFDEPTTGLDPVVENTIHQLMMTCTADATCTDIVVSHNIGEVMKISDKVVMLHEGEIIESGTPDEIAESDNSVVRQFLTGSPDGPIQIY